MSHDAEVNVVEANFLCITHCDLNALSSVAGQEKRSRGTVGRPIAIGVLADRNVPGKYLALFPHASAKGGKPN